MFKQVRGGEDPGGAAAAVAAWLLRSWLVRAAAIGLAVALLGAALYANALYRSANEPQCAVLPPVELSMEEVIALRRRIAAYQVDPSPTAALLMSGAEISAVYGESPTYQMRVDLRGDRARVDLAVPHDAGCWNVRFAGRVDVIDGVVHVVPDDLAVGGADLGWLVRNRAWTVSAEWEPDDHLGKLLDNTTSLDVEEGRAVVRLTNRWDVW